jgi:hypothetical protein
MIARRQSVAGTHHRRLVIKRHGVKYLTKPLDVPDDPFVVLRRCVHGSRYLLFGKLLSPQQVRLNPDLTLDEHCELIEEIYGIRVSNATMSRAFKRLGLPLKKSRSSPQRGTKKSEHAGTSA